jgi:hypothetical protein
MVARSIPANPERTGWTVLLAAFGTLLAVVGAIVFGGRWWLQSAAREQTICMVSSGTVLVTRPGRTVPEVNLACFPAGSKIASETNAQASLTFTSPDGQQVLATIRLFGNTQLEILEARSPRFSTGVGPHRIRLSAASGRVRAQVGVELDRDVRVEIESAPGALTILSAPGSNASVEATATATMVTVREGEVTVTAQNVTVPLGKDQRVAVAPGLPPSDPLTAEQNLIRNGDFAEQSDGTWQRVVATPADPAEDAGIAEVRILGGRRVLYLSRQGRNWGRVGWMQDLGSRDVQGYTSLRLNVDILIAAQSLRNCGQNGSECPLMVKIIYVDVGGGTHEWLQGFYWFWDPNPLYGPTYCVSCSLPFKHLQWPFGKWQPYTSENLLEVWAASGTPAAQLKSITILGEGHTFTSMATDVQLLATE